MRAAPFGVPVVPEVYWMIARSSVPGLGCDSGIGAAASNVSQATVPRTFSVNAARDSRAFATGSRRATRVRNGMALVTSTAMRFVTARSAGNSCTVETTLFHTIACFAPWSSNCLRNSRGV